MILKKAYKDNQYRKTYKKFELNKKYYKYIFQNQLLSDAVRYAGFKKLMWITSNSSISKIKNRCIMSGKSKSVFRSFKLSRIMFRKLANNGNIIGITKGGW